MLRKLAFFVLVTVIFAIPLWALAQPTLPPAPDQAVMTSTPVSQFTVVVTATPLSPTATLSLDSTSLQYNQTIDRAFDSNENLATFSFNGHKGELVGIRLDSFYYGLTMSVQSSAGVLLGTGTSSTYNNMRGYALVILPFTLPSDDTYIIWIGNASLTRGAYSLTLFTPPLNSAPFGQTVESELTVDEPAAYYCFTGKAGDVVTVALNSTDMNTYLMVSPFGTPNAIAQINDNSNNSTNALIGPYTLPQDGLYIILVTSSEGTAAGHYSLLLNKLDIRPIAYGDEVQAEFTAQTPFLYYTYEAKANDLVTVHADSQNGLDTKLAMLDPYNNVMVSDDDGANGFDPEILNIQIPADGWYSIQLMPYTAGATGTVTLSLENLPSLALDDGSQETQLRPKQPVATFSFRGVANQHVQLRIEMEGNCSPSVSISQNDQSIAELNMTGLPVVTAEFVVPASGEVKIRVISHTDLQIRLSLERLNN